MIPLLLISRNQKKTDDFIERFIKENDINSSWIFTIRPVTRELSIDQIRTLKRELAISTNKKRLIIIYGLDISGAEVQNALLKTLEEKQENNQFIFIVSHGFSVLPTIQSRSKTIVLNKTEVVVSESTRELMNRVKVENEYEFLLHPIVSAASREDALAFLDEILEYSRKQLLEMPEAAVKTIKKILRLRELIINNNINVQLAVDNLLIYIKKLYSIKQRI